MKKLLLLGLLLGLLGQQAFAHPRPRTDSLLRELRTAAPDTNRLRVLHALVQQFCVSEAQPAKGAAYAAEALALAQQLNAQVWVGKALCKVGQAHQYQGHCAEALGYFERSLRVARKLHNGPLQANNYYELGRCYMQLGRYKDALFSAQRALTLYGQRADKSRLTACLTLAAICYDRQGNYVQANAYNLKALKLAEEAGNFEAGAMSAANLAVLSYRVRNYAQAENHWRYALNATQKLNNPLLTANILVNLANLTAEYKHDYRQALAYHRQALRVGEEAGDGRTICLIYSNLGDIYLKTGDLKAAQTALLQALAVARRVRSASVLTSASLTLSELYAQTKAYPQAVAYGQEGLRLARQLGDAAVVSGGHKVLAETYKAAGNYRAALEHHEAHQRLQDSLSGRSTAEKVAQLQVQYETEKKEGRIRTLAHEAQLQQLKLRQQRTYLVGLVALAGLLAATGVLLLRQRVLRARQQQATLEQKLLRLQMNPHFIFNALTAIQGVVLQHNPAQAGRYLAKFAKLMRTILEDSQQEYISLDKEIGGLENYLSLQKLRFRDRFDYAIRVDPALCLEETAVPPMLAQPLVENALEHGLLPQNGSGRIEVRFARQNEMVRIEVQDNGVGQRRAAEFKQAHRAGHRSMAAGITQERLALLNRRQKRPVKWSLVDLVDAENVVRGTVATFLFPFRRAE